MYVIWRNMLCKLLDSIRGSLFADYQRLYPTKKVNIEVCDTKEVVEVELKDVVDHSVFRNT